MVSKLTSRQNFLRYREHRIFKALVIAAAIAGVATLAEAAGPVVGVSLFVPPLAACLFLVIVVPESAMAQPRALLGGQVLCAAISIAVMHFLPWPELVVAGVFFLSVAAMIMTWTVHAPVAATIYFVIVSHAS
jgi:CBS domain-containing membrane protein